MKTEESANQSKGCDAKLKGLEYGSQLNFLNHTAHGHHLKGGRSPKYKTQSVVPAIWPVRRFLCLRWVQRRVFLGFCKKEEFYEKAVRQLVGCSMYDICTVASERNYGVCRKTSANWLLWC